VKTPLLLIMNFSPVSCYVLPLWPKYLLPPSWAQILPLVPYLAWHITFKPQYSTTVCSPQFVIVYWECWKTEIWYRRDFLFTYIYGR
jgi:hypothetical protein